MWWRSFLIAGAAADVWLDQNNGESRLVVASALFHA